MTNPKRSADTLFFLTLAQNIKPMRLKDSIITIATSASLASDFIYSDKRHLHIHNAPVNPTYIQTGVYVYGQMFYQAISQVSYLSLATLVTIS